jgi:hypothetical protein
MRALVTAAPLALLLASAFAHAEDPVAAAGKQRAAASRIEWDVRDAGHPVLGSVRFAYMKSPVVTPVGISRVYSNVYVSCAANGRTIAFELTNQAAPDDPGGLKPATMPRLVCKSPAAGAAGTVQEAIEAKWRVSEIGDALARGFEPRKLRACATIAIVQDVALPKGWALPSVPVQLEITPYAKALDSIFTTCGETSAYASPPAAAAQVAATPPAPPAPQPPADPAWKVARTTSASRTNVRAEPNTHSAIVAKLDPGAVIFVQRAGGDWYRAKARNGPRFDGYIREDRLVVK